MTNPFILWEIEMLEHHGSRLADLLAMQRAHTNYGNGRPSAILDDLREADRAYRAFPTVAWWESGDHDR